MASPAPVFAVLFLTVVASIAVPGLSRAEIDWPADIYDPHPSAGDLVLPMPCGGAMVFRAVVVPGKDMLDDRRIVVGGLEASYAYKENQRADFIAGAFDDVKESGERRYYIGKYDVTRLQFASVREQCSKPTDDARLPQTNISWFEAVNFADTYSLWLHANAPAKLPKEKGLPGYVRLPTETEWEFAARGGAKVSEADFAAPLFPMTGSLASYVQYAGPDSSNNELQWVGLLKPNPLDLYDILGNASQFVFSLFQLNRLTRPHGQAGGFVVRGGNYLTSKEAIRTAARDEFPPYDAKGPRREKTVGFRLAIVAPVLPTPQSVREAVLLWSRLPEEQGGGLKEPVLDDPIKEVDILARATQDPQMKQRLEGLRTVIAANINARNDQRDRAARASLNLATWLAGILRDDVRKLLARQEIIALGNDQAKQQLASDTNALRSVIGYYRDTLRHILDEYPLSTRTEQANVLRQELQQRNAGAQAQLVATVERDCAQYQKDGDLTIDGVEAELQVEYCRGDGKRFFPQACQAHRN